MDVSLFDFDLPEDRIALRPASPRDSARMLVVRPDGRLEHRFVRDLPDYLTAGDAVVVNDTKVIAARLHGYRARKGLTAKIEILLHKRLSPCRFSALARPARKLLPGDELEFGSLRAQVVARREAGEVELDFTLADAALDMAIAAEGELPLPPYISGKRQLDMRDAVDYQTTYARVDGSVAAPTAGLHFTPELLAKMREAGIVQEAITLHVGLGTFLPVTADNTAAHRMHAETFELDAGTARRLNDVHRAGGRITAIGTTSLRALESAASPNGIVSARSGETDIFITPGYRFRAVDMLLTNFHLPRSTLFMLVSAFMGLEIMKRAYSVAIATDYRFYSYGDACLLWRPR